MSDVASNLDTWSQTSASNSPAGTVNIGTGLDDNLREIQAVVRKYLATKGADIASAATTDLSTATGHRVDITGTTTITAFGTLTAGMWKILKFTGALTLTHNGTSLQLPGSANITTANGDFCMATSLGSGNWEVNWYQPKTGLPVITTFSDLLFRVSGSSDATKLLAVEVDGFTTGTTRTITPPNMDTLLVSTIVKRKTADESVTSSTTLQDDDHLTFAIAANEEWIADFFVSGTFNGTNGGIKFAVTAPAGATLEASATGGSGTTASISVRTTTSGTSMGDFTFSSSPTTTVNHIHVWVLNGATPGSVTLQWAQAASFGTATLLAKGSHMIAHRVA